MITWRRYGHVLSHSGCDKALRSLWAQGPQWGTIRGHGAMGYDSGPWSNRKCELPTDPSQVSIEQVWLGQTSKGSLLQGGGYGGQSQCLQAGVIAPGLSERMPSCNTPLALASLGVSLPTVTLTLII